MPFCGKESVCIRCGGVLGCASESPLVGAAGVARFSETSRGPLEDLAEVRRIIESSNRSDEENQQLMAYIINKCPNEKVKEWLKGYFQELVILPLVDMYYFLIKELKKKKEIDPNPKKKNNPDIDIIFVAHGCIDSSMFPADCLMPLPSIRDVVLYSPWNCAINADVAYGVATGSIQTRHRVFGCSLPPPEPEEEPEQPEQPEQPEEYCPYPDEFHQPTKLPNCWNSMKKAGGSRIPNILVSPLKKPEDPAWNRVVFLQERLGEPGINRVLIPFTQGWMGFHKEIPFLIVTLVLSVVLYLFDCRATVHLAACLCRSEAATLNEAELKRQYEYTIDNTGMGSLEERIRELDESMYKFFKDVFG